MRTIRVVAGFALAASALAIIVGEQLSGVSADAVINARLTTIRSPIAGTLTFRQRELGTHVELGEELGSVADRLVDNIHVNDLKMERAIADAEIERLGAEADAMDRSMELLRQRAELYAEQRVRQLKVRIEERQALARALKARLDEANSAFDRSSALMNRGMETAVSYDRAQASVGELERQLDAANAESAAAEIDLEAAQAGVYLGEGYNDAPSSEQQLAALTVERARIGAELVGETSKAASLDRRIEDEQLRVGRLSAAPIRSNVRGRLWTILAADQESIQPGQDIAQLVNCDSTLVTLSVAESVYNTLAVGDAADFRVNGETRLFPGTVVRLAGSGASSVYRNLAVAPSLKHLERYDVALNVPGLQSDDNLDCAIGRTGRVFFQHRPLDGLRSLWN